MKLFSFYNCNLNFFLGVLTTTTGVPVASLVAFIAYLSLFFLNALVMTRLRLMGVLIAALIDMDRLALALTLDVADLTEWLVVS
jgi:hypothetical protein